MFKRIRRYFAGNEIGVLGAEIEELERILLDVETRLDSLTKRFNQAQARFGMRDLRERMRSERAGPGARPQQRQWGQLSDDEILDEINALDSMARTRGLN